MWIWIRREEMGDAGDRDKDEGCPSGQDKGD